jgi:chemotaxis protein methyltransferase CheR
LPLIPEVRLPPGMLTLPRLSDDEFEQLRGIIYARFGISLSEKKRQLVISRLYDVLQRKKLRNFEEYLNYLAQDQSGQAVSELADRISTNHTFFFREQLHFEVLLSQVLPQTIARLRAEDSPDLRIWCAGCATGEEAYTLAMLLLEYFGLEYPQWSAGVLATDISTHALSFARAGIYPEDRAELVPPTLKYRYFRQKGKGLLAVTDRVRQEVTFRRFNLINPAFPFKKPFHVIFCRNVMMYFDAPAREALVQRLYDATAPGGYLFIGHSEALERSRCPYEYVRPAVYQKGQA